MEANHTPLFGGCTCGRNQYTISIPSAVSASVSPLIRLEDTTERSLSRSSPFAMHLRVPLDWLHSTTYAFFSDETHHGIRRVFTPRHSSQTKRVFCGYCGTSLTIWSEAKACEADFVRVDLGSLTRSSLDELEELGLLSISEESHQGSDEEGTETQTGMALHAARGPVAQISGRTVSGHPWFEESLEGSKLGRARRKRGAEVSADGRSKVEWEIVVYEGDKDSDAVGSVSTKRKIGSVAGGDEVVLRTGH